MSIGKAISAAETFMSKEISGTDSIIKSITAFIEKETPNLRIILADVETAYNAAKVAIPYVEGTVIALAQLYTELSISLK